MLEQIMSFQNLVNPFLMFCLALFPLTNSTTSMNYLSNAIGSGKYITMDNLFTEELFQHNTLGYLVVTALVFAVICILILIYIWPLTISPDREHPLRWYYPCTCQCFRSHASPESDSKIDEEAGSPTISSAQNLFK
jgi:hypothetical protein